MAFICLNQGAWWVGSEDWGPKEQADPSAPGSAEWWRVSIHSFAVQTWIAKLFVKILGKLCNSKANHQLKFDKIPHSYQDAMKTLGETTAVGWAVTRWCRRGWRRPVLRLGKSRARDRGAPTSDAAAANPGPVTGKSTCQGCEVWGEQPPGQPCREPRRPPGDSEAQL